jgi:hypothetical protein
MFLRNAMTGELTEVWAAPSAKFDPVEELDAELMRAALAKPVTARTPRAEREKAAAELVHPGRFWEQRAKQAAEPQAAWPERKRHTPSSKPAGPKLDPEQIYRQRREQVGGE